MLVATSRSISYPIAERIRWIRSPVAAASGSTSASSPRSPFVRWWSMLTSRGHFSSSWPTRPVRSGEPQSTTTATSYFDPSSAQRAVSAPGRKRRLSGTGSVFSTVAVFPIFRRARASASSDPIASPSGFSWHAMRKRSFSCRTRQIAERSPLTRTLLFLRNIAEDRVDPGAAVERVVVVELQFGGVPQAEEMAELPPQETGGPTERLCHGRALPGSDECGVIHVGDPKVLRHGNLGDGDRRQARVVHLPQQDEAELFPDSLADTRGAVAAALHSVSLPSGWKNSTREERSSTSPSRPIPPAILSSIDRASLPSVVTSAAPTVPRCQRSCPPTSATDTGKFARMRATRPARRRRLSFRDAASGKRRSAIRTATS